MTQAIAATASGSGSPDDLALITRPSVALAQWWRAPAVAITERDLDGFASVHLEGDPGDAEASIAEELALGPSYEWHAALAADAAMLADRFATIARCAEIALRLELVEGDACRRFHADYVWLRLITTYVGPGTQWIIDGAGDPMVREVATGHVALFKGRCPGPVGILHRSPPITGTNLKRLLLVIDPLPRPDHM